MLYVDGGVIPPGAGVYWSVAVEIDGVVTKWTDQSSTEQYTTNNEAEYMALMDAFRHLGERPELSPGDVRIASDSTLIVNQFNGKYKIKKDHLKVLHAKAKAMEAELIAKGWKIWVYWLRREYIVPRLGH